MSDDDDKKKPKGGIGAPLPPPGEDVPKAPLGGTGIPGLDELLAGSQKASKPAAKIPDPNLPKQTGKSTDQDNLDSPQARETKVAPLGQISELNRMAKEAEDSSQVVEHAQASLSADGDFESKEGIESNAKPSGPTPEELARQAMNTKLELEDVEIKTGGFSSLEPEEEEEEEPPPPWPDFPAAEVKKFLKEAFIYIRALPPKFQYPILIVPPVFILGVLVWLLVALSSPNVLFYMAERTDVMNTNEPESDPEKLFVLERGEDVTVYGNFGDTILIRDAFGRVGYVRSEVLSEIEPPSVPTEPFSGCRPNPKRGGAQGCRSRAQSQLEACNQFCEDDDGGNSCLGQCQTRFSDCIWLCDELDKEVPEVKEDEPTAEPAAIAPARAKKTIKKKRRKKARRKRKKRR